MKSSRIMSRARDLVTQFHAARAARARRRPGSDYGPFALGRVVIRTRDVDPVTGEVGEWVTRHDDHNLVVTQAQNLTANCMAGVANSTLSYIELGNPSPATPPALSDITLQQSTGQRMAVTLTVSGNVVEAQATWGTTQGNGFTYTEAGLFTGVLGSGSMYARKIFTGITKTNAFQLQLSWYITYLTQSTGGDCTGIGFIGPSTVSAYTLAIAAGGEVSVGATFDFAVGSNNVDVFLNGARLEPGTQYNEAGPPLNAPCLGSATNKGINFAAGISLNPGDRVLLVHRSLAS